MRLMYSVICLFFAGVLSAASPADYRIEKVVENLPFAWSFCFLEQDTILFTEINGGLRLIQNGALVKTPIKNVPAVFRAGQGGLMDVKADPNFKQNKTIYLSYAFGTRKANSLRLMKAKLINGALTDTQILFTATPMRNTAHHYGARILLLPDDTLLLTVGDGYNFREQAQTLDNHFGKIIRIRTDGSIPDDNPFINTPNALAEIWSYGHRNPQGLTPAKHNIYSSEHGPRGGDEINRIQAGKNYGWPVITYGIDYNGAQITPYTSYKGMEQPLVNWTPSIAPAATVYYDNPLFPWLQNSLLTVSLAEKSVRQVQLSDDAVLLDKHIFTELSARLRDIKVAENGEIFVLSDGSNNILYKISKK